MAAVKLAFTWLGVRKTLAPEQRTTAARAFHADRDLLSASKLILDTRNPAYRAVAAVRSEASTYWRTVTLPFPEAGIRLLPQNSLRFWGGGHLCHDEVWGCAFSRVYRAFLELVQLETQ